MKKFLSVALALAMTLSLVVVGASAKSFTDKDKINYKEAVDVVNAVKIIDGYTDGSFNPSATLTRGAAAKIICNMVLGPTTANALGVTAAPFKDVSTKNVFAGYIAYCAKQGIINGYADKTFRPAGTVTGYQFLKMLLGALGYDASVEGFTGSNWEVNVAKLASNQKLTSGNSKFVGTAAMTREEACLYAYNTLKTTLVEYADKGQTITVNGVTIATGASKASYVTSTLAKEQNISTKKLTTGEYTVEFGERYFPGLKLTSGVSDSFANDGEKWTNGTATIGQYNYAPDVTYTAKTTAGKIYSDLGLSANVAADKVIVYIDGVKADNTATITRGGNNTFGGNGTVMNVTYDADAKTVTIVEINTYVGDVTSVQAATASADAYVTISPRNAGTGDKFTTTDFALDDVVLYTYSKKDKAIISADKAKVVEGKVTAFTTGSKVTLDTTAYDYSANVANEAKSVNKNYAAKVVLDKYGYAIDVDTTSTMTNYAAVLQYKESAGTYGNDTIAQLLMTDGTVKDVVLSAKNEALQAGVSGNTYQGTLVTYTINNNGKYELTVPTKVTGYPEGKNVASVGPNITIVTNNQSDLNFASGTSANASTIFLVKTSNGTNDVYTVYTGIKAVPTIKTTGTGSASASVIYKIQNNKVVTGVAGVVYIDATKSTLSTSSKDVIFVKADSNVKVTNDSVKGNYFTYDAIVNGEPTTLNLSAAIAHDTIASSISYDANKVATLGNTVNAFDNTALTSSQHMTALVDSVFAVNTATKADNEIIGLGNTNFTYAKDCKVFVVDENRNISTGSVKGIGDYAYADGAVIFAKQASSTDKELTTIVVVKKAATTPTIVTGTYATGVDKTVNGASTLLNMAVNGTKVTADNKLKVSILKSGDEATQIKDALTYLGYTVSKTAKSGNVYTITATKNGVENTITCDTSADVTYIYTVTVNGTKNYAADSATVAVATPSTKPGTGYIVNDGTSTTYAAYGANTYTVAAKDVTITTGYVTFAAPTLAGATTTNAFALTYTIDGATVANAPSYVKAGAKVAITLTAKADVTNGATTTTAGTVTFGTAADAALVSSTGIILKDGTPNTNTVVTIAATQSTKVIAKDSTITGTWTVGDASFTAVSATYVAAN